MKKANAERWPNSFNRGLISCEYLTARRLTTPGLRPINGRDWPGFNVTLAQRVTAGRDERIRSWP